MTLVEIKFNWLSRADFVLSAGTQHLIWSSDLQANN